MIDIKFFNRGLTVFLTQVTLIIQIFYFSNSRNVNNRMVGRLLNLPGASKGQDHCGQVR